MPLVKALPPKLYERAFRKGLEEMIQMDGAPAGLTGWLALRNFSLTLGQAVSGNGLSGVRPGPWRFVTGSPKGPAVAIVVSNSPRGHRPKMTSMTSGLTAQKAFDDLEEIEKLPAVRRRQYVLRRLRVAGLVGAYWLAPRGGSAKDLVIPYFSVVPRLKDMKPYSIDEFLARIRPVAQHRLDHAKK